MDNTNEPAPFGGDGLALAADWDAVRADYEDSALSVDEVLLKHGVTRSALNWKAKRYLWTMRRFSRASDRPALLARMFRVLEKQVLELENNTMTTGEKEVNLLGAMAKTLEKLMELDTGIRGGRAHTTERKDIADLRDQLAHRIDQLAKR